MNDIVSGDIVILKSEKDIKMTVTALLVGERIEASFWNASKGEFQIITGSKFAFQKVNE